MSDNNYDDLLSRVLQAAIRNQDAVDKACKEMVKATQNIEQRTNQLVNHINKELEEATNKAANDLIKKFELADRCAERSTMRYERVSFWNPIKFYVILMIIGGFVVIGITVIMLNIIPTKAEISERIEILKQINSSISENKIELNYCDNRRCVRVNKNMSEQKFLGDNGEVYLILNNY
ncbi:MAG: hypothetical protein AAF383_18470 [Cyanobacteria bacterium P01_A01_bin.83]